MAATPAANEHNSKLFVGNLPFTMSTSDLSRLFQPFGQVIGVKLVEDRGTGKKKGFGFITFATSESADKAILAMQEVDVQGRRLTVKRATFRGEKPSETDVHESDDEEPDPTGAGQPSGTNDDEWATTGPKKKKSREPTFKQRADAKAKEGKVLGWGGGDDDWA